MEVERKGSVYGRYTKRDREVVRDKAGGLGQVSVGPCKPVKEFALYPEGNENPLRDFKQGSGLMKFLGFFFSLIHVYVEMCFFFFNLFIIYYLFIFGCVWSLLLCAVFL